MYEISMENDRLAGDFFRTVEKTLRCFEPDDAESFLPFPI